jgi:hypothetical protein
VASFPARRCARGGHRRQPALPRQGLAFARTWPPLCEGGPVELAAWPASTRRPRAPCAPAGPVAVLGAAWTCSRATRPGGRILERAPDVGVLAAPPSWRFRRATGRGGPEDGGGRRGRAALGA